MLGGRRDSNMRHKREARRGAVRLLVTPTCKLPREMVDMKLKSLKEGSSCTLTGIRRDLQREAKVCTWVYRLCVGGGA